MTVETGDALDDGAVVGRHVDAKQLVEGGHCVVLVDSPGGAAISDVVLRARSHVVLAGDERGAPRRPLAGISPWKPEMMEVICSTSLGSSLKLS